MKIYQFIRYDDNSLLQNLFDNADKNTIFCFDLEDSIQDSIQPANTPFLKSSHRNILKSILEKIRIHSVPVKIGVRINGVDTTEYLQDIEALSESGHISTIFLPKANNADQVLDLQNRLQLSEVNYTEIIPVIETKSGLLNLESILKIKSNKITAIAFGHCDYNFDNGIYPFIHQDEREYWNWVIKMYKIIRHYQVTFVNSPFLKLRDDLSFRDMLSLLYSICGDHFGQITLTGRQSKLCSSFIPDKTKTITEKTDNPLDLKVPESYATDFIEAFGKSERKNGFAITPDRMILSPHEFFASKQYLDKIKLPEINFTFVGGCFPVKGNVLFEDRFHQIMKKEIENRYEVRFNVNIIRYERYMNCINRISASEKANPMDILVFSIRPEPFLRLVKLYYKYADTTDGKIRRSFNLPFLNNINPEKHDVLSADTRFHPLMLGSKSNIRKAFINLNYIFGLVIGNDKYSRREYLKLLNNVIDFCKMKNIQLLVLGPAIRTNTIMEKLLSRKLDTFFRKALPISSEQFISGADLERNGEPVFEKNGIYVNEKYHEVIAERMGSRVRLLIDKMMHSNVGLARTEEALHH
ncbi:MAG TPA: aldolase/citrate lyase family protein [Saprospiraceae bacterium]|nr:aldolase/citrate lyase family protein [Saprospiraceae bacterium]